MRFFLPLLLLGTLVSHAQTLPPGTKPLASAAPKGRGPLALMNLNHLMLGSANVSGGKGADLFLAGAGGTPGVYWCRWVDTAEAGAPVFAPPVLVKCPFKDDGVVFQTKDGAVHAVWTTREELVQTTFDKEAVEFREVARVPLEGKLKSASSLGVLTNADGSLDLAFEVSSGGKGPEGKPNTEEWRPFNSSGVAAGELRYRHLMGAHVPALLKGPVSDVRQITRTQQEAFFSMRGIAAVNLGAGYERDLVTGSRQGNLLFYHNAAASGFKLDKKRLLIGEDGFAIRHPSINANVCAYPDAAGRFCDLIVSGEGAVYFYRFTGRFTEGGTPVYAPPVPVLQEQADLYAGTLPSPTTVDWNGDGVLDIVVGNSEGFILFFQNTGTDEKPAFLPAVNVQAGGRDIHVQAGYSGSVQGVQEARWGYLSPNVTDWNGDSLPDIITGDITGNVMIYVNRGTAQQPKLDPARPIYCDGLDLHGMWRVRPAVARVGDRMALALVDGSDHFHLYWRIDDHNVEDGGKLLLEDGKPIGASGGVGGMSGRCKLDLFDWNGDGQLDLIIGTNRVNSIPDRETGYPMAALGKNPTTGTGLLGSLVDAVLPAKLKKTLGTPLLMLNKGTNDKMRFARPVPFRDEAGRVIQPGGAHETGAVGTMLGGQGSNLLICNEVGRLFLLPGDKIKPASSAAVTGAKQGKSSDQ